MRNKKFSILYGIGSIQIVGVILLFYDFMFGIILITICILVQIGLLAGLFCQKNKVKICPECKAAIPKHSRICSECGHLYQKGASEEELTEIIEKEKEKQLTSEEIDCDFEKIEEVAVEEISAFDGDIEAFLSRKEKEEI